MAWRSIVDGAWTFVDVRVRKPQLRLEIDGDGHSNFHGLLGQFSSEPVQPGDATTTVPAVRMHPLALSGGYIEWLDATPAQPLVTRVEALNVDLRGSPRPPVSQVAGCR
jgi:hypothetical protein